MSFDFTSEPVNPPEKHTETIGNSQESIDAQADVDFDSLIDGTEDPVKSKKLWQGTPGLIMSNIPKGQIRKFALDEKNLFLKASANTTEGKFTFLYAIQTTYDIAERWLRSNADAVELGMEY
ncbi:hypothetical protein [Larkinella soli]|uniref:hypothetical protein n=1 Tax=Larkinella soli TaxID=1770527 RepID=UPI000FFC45B8|nr:hypothetical protein [Larkinella soli]